MSPKNALALGSFAVALFGGPITSIATSVGVGATLGLIKINLVRRRRQLQALQSGDPVHFLQMARKRKKRWLFGRRGYAADLTRESQDN